MNMYERKLRYFHVLILNMTFNKFCRILAALLYIFLLHSNLCYLGFPNTFCKFNRFIDIINMLVKIFSNVVLFLYSVYFSRFRSLSYTFIFLNLQIYFFRSKNYLCYATCILFLVFLIFQYSKLPVSVKMLF